MSRPIRNFDEVGAPRTNTHRGGRPQKYVLDERKRRLMLDLYDGTPENIDKLVSLLGVPRDRVKRWGREMGLARQNDHAWTDEEIQYLQDTYKRKGVKTMAKHLGRTASAVKHKLVRLNLHCAVRINGYTMQDVKLALGNDYQTIVKWIEKGWLKGKKQGPESRIWKFTDKNIRDFIVAHPNEVDPRRADWLWLVDLLAGGDKGIGELSNPDRETSA